MDYPLEFNDLTRPEQVQILKNVLLFILNNLDQLPSTTTDPNGNLTGRTDQVILYNNGGTRSLKVCTGGTTWQVL